MKRLNRRGYLTIEIILGATIAFAIAFLLIEITAKMVSDTEDNYKDTIIQTDTPLIISGVKEVIENHDNGIESIENRNDGYEIKYKDGKTGFIILENKTIKYIEDDVVKYERELDSSLSNISVTSNIEENNKYQSNIYIKIVGKNIFTGEDYDMVIPIENYAAEKEENKEPDTLAEYITRLYTASDIPKVQVYNNNIGYNYAKSEGLMNDALGGNNSNLDTGNVRYYGANPNNYIYFNCKTYPNTDCERWRIIGVFKVKNSDGTEVNKVKIIRETDLDVFIAWDATYPTSYASDVIGYSNWGGATIQKLLNNGYYNGNKVGTAYYQYNEVNKRVPINVGKIGIQNDETRGFISTTIWNTGGIRVKDANMSDLTSYPDQVYKEERGTYVSSKSRSTWTGNVGLMYPSDYAYAADFTNCKVAIGSYARCKSNNWLYYARNFTDIYFSSKRYTNYNNELTITELVTGNNADIVRVNGGSLGKGISNVVHHSFARPVLYLDTNTLYLDGDGSTSNPYQISMRE